MLRFDIVPSSAQETEDAHDAGETLGSGPLLASPPGGPGAFPIGLLRLKLLVLAALFVTVLLFMGWDAYRTYRLQDDALPTISRLQRAQAELLRLEEEMHLSAMMASATGGAEWRLRYRRARFGSGGLLSGELRQFRSNEALARALRASVALDRLREEAFSLLAGGRVVEARRIFSSQQAALHKRHFVEAMRAFDAGLVRDERTELTAILVDKKLDATTTLVSLALLLAFALYGIGATRRWERIVSSANRRLSDQAQELAESNDRLEARVIERTKELTESARASLSMMESAIRERERSAEAHRKLEFLAYYDPLTGLANRSLFLERVGLYQRSALATWSGTKLVVVLIDLERFKNINDSLGRAAGDELLKQFALWLTHAFGDGSQLARVGADLFAAILPAVREASDVARILATLVDDMAAHRFRLADGEFRVSARFGVAMYPEDGEDADVLFKHAEAALRKAKAGGERYLFFTQAMGDSAAGKLTMENQLRQAVDNEEFVLHYQAKVNIHSGKLTGAEALIRWNDPRTGLVLPEVFIPILEETGLINEVGRWALRRAVQDHARWRQAGLDAAPIAVNVSTLQLRRQSFVGEIEEAIGGNIDAANGLEIEITESMLMHDVPHSIASLSAIRAMGVCIAIDDFGTGFSSLSYLSRLPIDTLKIDRSFVVGMTTTPQGLSVVSSIIALARSLKMKVIAEGVETEEQLELLRAMGCEEMQGFLYGRPLPCQDFESRFLTNPPTLIGLRSSVQASEGTATT